MPDVIGRSLNAAQNDMKAAGFTNVSIGSCKQSEKAPDGGQVTATDPAGGTSANKNTGISLTISAKECP